MTFTIIEVIALFFIAINLSIILIFLGFWVDQFFKYKAKIKIEKECKTNHDLVQVIASYCKYAQLKGDTQARLTDLTRMLSPEIKKQLNQQYGYRVVLNGLSEVCVRGWADT